MATYHIGDATVDVEHDAVVATISGRAARAPGFLSGARRLGGFWRGNRVSFRPEHARQVLDLVGTHYGIDGSDPTALGPPDARALLVLSGPRTLTILPERVERSELETLEAMLPTLEERVRILTQRATGATRARDRARARIAELRAAAE
jgi:hypothetical protein